MCSGHVSFAVFNYNRLQASVGPGATGLQVYCGLQVSQGYGFYRVAGFRFPGDEEDRELGFARAAGFSFLAGLWASGFAGLWFSGLRASGFVGLRASGSAGLRASGSAGL